MNENTATQPVVELKDGALMGRIKDAVYLFSGIPYAAPPVGPARFKAAQPVQPWDGIRDATKFGPAAPQIPSGGMTDRVPVRWSEDCLTLNVATPSITGDKKAVLVWIHGGAYRSGQGAIPWYNGSSFATLGNIVVVTINYRLGALGFTDLSSFAEGYETSGVNGLLDQIKALEWVQNNIGAFGGDPERVTIAGESAGAFSVTTLLGAARARGLFHRAIPQSGAAHHTLTQAQGLRVAELLMQETQSTDVQALIDCPVETLLNAQNTASARYHTEHHSPGVQAFYPVSGNEIIPTTLLEAIEAGVGRDIPVLIGTNQDESSLFMLDRQRTARPKPKARLMAAVTCTNTMRASFRALAPETLPFGWQPIFHSSCRPCDWPNCAQKRALKPMSINLTGPREFQGSAPLTPLRFPLSLICCTRQALQPLSGQARYPKVSPVTCTTFGSTSLMGKHRIGQAISALIAQSCTLMRPRTWKTTITRT